LGYGQPLSSLASIGTATGGGDGCALAGGGIGTFGLGGLPNWPLGPRYLLPATEPPTGRLTPTFAGAAPAPAGIPTFACAAFAAFAAGDRDRRACLFIVHRSG
jgi:hypothetical protein